MSNQDSTLIRLENLRKEFGDLVAVEGLDLEVGEGEFMCFLGPSGCGKTTTLRMVAGLETPTSGDVYLHGRRITELSPQERNVGFVFQNYALFWHMTVYDNLAFGLRVRQAQPAEIDDRVRAVADSLELADLLDVKAARLDLSAMQRVAMARALANRPLLLLADEPTGNLDSRTSEEILSLFDRLWEAGSSIIMVTHEQSVVARARRIIRLKDGRIDSDEAVVREGAG